MWTIRISVRLYFCLWARKFLYQRIRVPLLLVLKINLTLQTPTKTTTEIWRPSALRWCIFARTTSSSVVALCVPKSGPLTPLQRDQHGTVNKRSANRKLSPYPVHHLSDGEPGLPADQTTAPKKTFSTAICDGENIIYKHVIQMNVYGEACPPELYLG